MYAAGIHSITYGRCNTVAKRHYKRLDQDYIGKKVNAYSLEYMSAYMPLFR